MRTTVPIEALPAREHWTRHHARRVMLEDVTVRDQGDVIIAMYSSFRSRPLS
jgi:hypothetical protein